MASLAKNIAPGQSAVFYDVDFSVRSGDPAADAAIAGGAGLFRVTAGRPRELMLSAPSLVGAAFDPEGGLAVASGDTVYRLDVGLFLQRRAGQGSDFAVGGAGPRGRSERPVHSRTRSAWDRC